MRHTNIAYARYPIGLTTSKCRHQMLKKQDTDVFYRGLDVILKSYFYLHVS